MGEGEEELLANVTQHNCSQVTNTHSKDVSLRTGTYKVYSELKNYYLKNRLNMQGMPSRCGKYGTLSG